MEVIKRKILLENSVDRTENSENWGSLTADTFYINVFLTQNIDDMGLFTDIDFISADTSSQSIVDYSILIDKLSVSGITFPFMVSQTPYLSATTFYDDILLRIPYKNDYEYYNFQNQQITGYTDSKINDVKSYDENERYKVSFNMNIESYLNYQNIQINGVNRVVSTLDPYIYVFDSPIDVNIGTPNQIYGLKYMDFTGDTRIVNIDGIDLSIPLTTFSFIGEARNETNTSLSALTKEEYLFGIISPTEVKNDVFIERSVISVFEQHLRLSEIKNLGQLTRYGNGYYNLLRQ